MNDLNDEKTQGGAPVAQNPPPYSNEQTYNASVPKQPPPGEPANPAMMAQYQPLIQPPQHNVVIVPVQPTHERDYLGYSIFTMLCCCLPLGIAALVYSIQTRDANHAGNGAEARKKSRMARNFAHTALGVGVVLIIVCIILNVVIINKSY